MNSIIEEAVEDLVSSFVYYDRKEDNELPLGWMEELIESGDLTIQDIAVHFAKTLRDKLGGNDEGRK